MKREKFSFFYTYRFLFVFLFCFYTAKGQTLWINEIMSDNASLVQDEDGDFSDWIELYNNNSEALDLSGWALSDDPDQLDKWRFPTYSILPGDYILVFASDKNRKSGVFFHTNFKLKSSGETLYISTPEGVLANSIEIPSLNTHSSYGRAPNGEGPFRVYFESSPWASNDSQALEAQIQCSQTSGFYESYPSISLSGNRHTDEIYYSLNGSVPVPGSPYTYLYERAFILPEIDYELHPYSDIPSTPLYEDLHPWEQTEGAQPKAIVLRAASFYNGIQNSPILNRSFFIDTEHDLPVISLMLDSCDLFDFNKGLYVPGQHLDNDLQKSGNYFQTGKDWERFCSFEYFSEDGVLQIHQNAGLRIHGNLSRLFPQKSLRLYARAEYGMSYFQHQFFKDRPFDKYKRLIIRTPQVSQRAAFFKDVVVHQWAKELGLNHMSAQASALYLNGEYWGIYTIRERLDRFYLEQHFGAQKDQFDYLSGIGDILEGDADEYNDLIAYIRTHDLSEEVHYQWLASRIDMANYLDYVIFETYISNIDWPGNNMEYWKKDGEKWKWLLIDTDASLGDPSYNMLEHATTTEGMPFENPEWSTLLLRELLKNESFKERFIARYLQLIEENFNYDKLAPLLQRYEAMYYTEIENQVNRWGFPSSTGEFSSSVRDLHYFLKNRPCMVKNHLEAFFDTELTLDVCEEDPIVDGGITPNPHNGEFSIHYFSKENTTATIRVHDYSGKELFKKVISLKKGYNSYPMDMRFLKPGLYITSLYSNVKLWQKKTIRL